MARMVFDSIFENTNGTLTPRMRIRIGGVELGPSVTITKGVSFGGIDFTQFIGRDLQVQTDNDVVVITGIYEEGQASD